MTIDDAMDIISCANGQRVEIETDDPLKFARAIKARLQRDGIHSYSVTQDTYLVHVFKTSPPRTDRKWVRFKGFING